MNLFGEAVGSGGLAVDEAESLGSLGLCLPHFISLELGDESGQVGFVGPAPATAFAGSSPAAGFGSPHPGAAYATASPQVEYMEDL